MPKATFTQPFYLAAGWISFAVGFIGIFLPLLPTTIFWIIAAGCWSKSNPALAQKIFAHPRFGKPIQVFLEHRQISRKGKCFASSGISLGYLVFLLTVKPSLFYAGLVGLVLAGVITWIVLLERPDETSESVV